MEKEVKNQRIDPEKQADIEYVKKWIDDLYESHLFYTFSLHTLELTRRFNNNYRLYKENRSAGNIRQLSMLAEKLEERLTPQS